MQTKKRAKPVKFGRQVEKEREIERENESVKHTPHESATHHAAPAVESPFKAEPVSETTPERSRPAEATVEKKESSNGDNFKTDELTKALAGFFKSIEDDADKEKDKEPVYASRAEKSNDDLKEEFTSGEREPEREIRTAESEARPEREEVEEPRHEREPRREEPEEEPRTSRAAEDEPRQRRDEEPEIEVEEQSVKVVHRSAFSNDFEEEKEVPEKRKGNPWVFFILVALVAFVVGLIAMAAYNQFKPGGANNVTAMLPKFGPEPTSTPLPTQTPTVAPTEAPVKLDAYTITIYNGSGITGEAAKLKAKLTDAGFKVGTVGNAASSDVTKTKIEARSTVSKTYLQKLQETLKKSYVTEDPATSTSITGDVVVTIGSTPAQ